MCNVQCSMCNVQCTLQLCSVYRCDVQLNYSVPVHCTLYIVQCTLYIVQCTVYNVHCITVYTHCTLYSVYCTEDVVHLHCTLHCTVYSAYCAAHSLLSTVQTAQCTVQVSSMKIKFVQVALFFVRYSEINFCQISVLIGTKTNCNYGLK